MRSAKWRMSAVIVPLAGAGLWFAWPGLLKSPPPLQARQVYRIRWTDSPPFEAAGLNGEAAGFAVDLISTAARRAADALRREIRAIAAERKPGPIPGESGCVSSHVESMEALLVAKRR